MTQRESWTALFLQAFGGIPFQNFQQLLKESKSLEGLHSQMEEWLGKKLEPEEVSQKWRYVTKNWEWIKKHSARHVWPGHPDYPASLLDLESPPLNLIYWGTLKHPFEKTLSIVGSREAHSLSREWMTTHLPALAKEGVCFVSGGARGVDQWAHYIAVSKKSPTVAFLPSGLAECYPPTLLTMIPEIIKYRGAVVSELLPYEPIRNYYFHQRNRLIVALSPMLLLIEAKRKSGSIMTARLAIENHRNLGVVPGSPVLRNWSGSCDLLANGAFPIRDAQDVQALLSIPVFSQKPSGEETKENIGVPDCEPRGEIALSGDGISCDVKTPIGDNDT